MSCGFSATIVLRVGLEFVGKVIDVNFYPRKGTVFVDRPP
jgi:hypothetical protein